MFPRGIRGTRSIGSPPRPRGVRRFPDEADDPVERRVVHPGREDLAVVAGRNPHRTAVVIERQPRLRPEQRRSARGVEPKPPAADRLEVAELDRARIDAIRIRGGIITPNEARRRERRGQPNAGGDTPWPPGAASAPRTGMPGMGTPGQPKKADTPAKAPGADIGVTEGA